jgi:hypothetical protein
MNSRSIISVFLILLVAGIILKIFTFCTPPSKKNTYFKDGEYIKFVMHYGWIDGGIGTLTLKETNFQGRKVYHAFGQAETIGFVNVLYNVHDIYESYFDKETCLPVKAIRNVIEGPRYKDYNETFFYHSEKFVISSKQGKKQVPDSLFDLMSALFHMRKNIFDNIQPGDLVVVKTYFMDQIYPLRVRFRGIDTVDTRIGRFSCMKFNPVVETGRVFDSQNDVTIWISNDKNFIPVRAQLDLMIGSFKADLMEYANLPFELTSLIKKR